MSRTTPRQDRSRATVERILAAADVEIGSVGLARTSTRRIAQRAGVSVGALYRFFADKEALAVALSQRYLDAAQAAYAPALSAVRTTADLPQAIAQLVRSAADLHREFPGYYRLTEESLPGLAESPAHVAREGLVDLFVMALAAIRGTADVDSARLRVRVELAIETVRHALAHSDPVDHEHTNLVVEELTTMLTAYLTA